MWWSVWTRRSQLLLTVVALLSQLVVPRPSSDKNELVKACYFTYKIGYVICDTGLAPEDAAAEHAAGRCNEDFRLMGADMQRRFVRYYEGGGMPPLEEAAWVITAPEHFQERTMQECPAMQVMSYFLLAEAGLYLHGPAPESQGAILAARALEQARQIPHDVYDSLAKAWPMDTSVQHFERLAHRLRALIADRIERFEVEVVLCRCEESLEWLARIVPEGVASLVVYEACSGLPLDAPTTFKAVYTQAVPTEASVDGECASEIVLAHLSWALAREAIPDYTLFLTASSPPAAEQGLLSMVAQSLQHRTLETAFLHLADRLTLPRALSPCERSLWSTAELAEGPRGTLPRGYAGTRFAVSGALLRAQPPERFARLLKMLVHPDLECTAEALRTAVAAAWHVVFGQPATTLARADDSSLPLFMRLAGDSTKLPKNSVYLQTSGSFSSARQR